MKSIEVKWSGIRPLLMNNWIGIDTTHPLVKEMGAINKKRTKTEDDTAHREWLQYQISLYTEDGIGPYIPTQNIEACIRDGAKKNRKGKDVTAAAFVSADKYALLASDGSYVIPLDYEGPRTTEELYNNGTGDFVYKCRVVQARQGILKVRPRFRDWSIRFVLDYDESMINKSDLADAALLGGQFIGLCDYRPRFGRFISEIG